MKAMKKLIIACVAGITLSSCAATLPYAVTNNPVNCKKGVSTTNVIFGTSGAWGGSIQQGVYSTNKKFGVIEAAKKGKIETIGSVDIKTTNYLIFKKVEVIVTGE